MHMRVESQARNEENVSESRVQLSTAKLLSVNLVFSMNLTLCRLFDPFVRQFLLL